jgi:hypothetical protein
MTVCALAAACWKVFIWQPPTHRISLYEKAPAFYGRTAKIGPNQIRIESVARNDRDGEIRIESGRGTSLDVEIPGKQTLVDCAGWLDVARIHLQPGGDLVELLEVRIFDHEQRELLSRLDPAYGWNVVTPNVLDLYGLQKPLPETVDVWLRVNSYEADDGVFTLPPTAGASVLVDGHQLTLHAAQAGFQGWSSSDGFVPLRGKHHAESAFEVRWKPSNDDRRYQIAAVLRDGERIVDDFFHTFNSQKSSVIMFPTPLESIDHLEIRPFGGRHRFFFDAIRLPEITSQDPFADPPSAVVKIGGKEIATSVAAFRPLSARVRTVDGNYGQGTTTSNTSMTLTPRPEGPTDRGEAFSLIVDARGLGRLPLAFRFRKMGHPNWLADSQMSSAGGASSFGSSRILIERNYRIPIESVDEVEISITDAP